MALKLLHFILFFPVIKSVNARPAAPQRRLVGEALAGLLPAARRAPQLPVLDAVNFTALLGLVANPPDKHTGVRLLGLWRPIWAVVQKHM